MDADGGNVRKLTNTAPNPLIALFDRLGAEAGIACFEALKVADAKAVPAQEAELRSWGVRRFRSRPAEAQRVLALNARLLPGDRVVGAHAATVQASEHIPGYWAFQRLMRAESPDAAIRAARAVWRAHPGWILFLPNDALRFANMPGRSSAQKLELLRLAT